MENDKSLKFIIMIGLIFSLILISKLVFSEEEGESEKQPAAKIVGTQRRDSYGLTPEDKALFARRRTLVGEQIYSGGGRSDEELLPPNAPGEFIKKRKVNPQGTSECSVTPFPINNICVSVPLTDEERELISGPNGNSYILACSETTDIVERYRWNQHVCGQKILAGLIWRENNREAARLLGEEGGESLPDDKRQRLINALEGEVAKRRKDAEGTTPGEETEYTSISLNNPFRDFDKLILLPPPDVDNGKEGLIPFPLSTPEIEGYSSPPLDDIGSEQLIPLEDEEFRISTFESIKNLFKSSPHVTSETKDNMAKAAVGTAAVGGFAAFLMYLDARVGLVLRTVIVCPEEIMDIGYDKGLGPRPRT